MRRLIVLGALLALGGVAQAAPGVDGDARLRAREYRGACARALAGHQTADAKAACEQSIAAWDGDPIAWYLLGSVDVQGGDLAAAREPFEHAVALRPEEPMFQMWLGITLEKDAAAQASAREHLARATAIEPRLWRAHYYLGRIARTGDDARTAADEFGRAIAAGPTHGAPYIALAMIYLRWGYVDQATAVADLGISQVTDASDLTKLHMARGIALVIGGHDDTAIGAFDAVLAATPDDHEARFQRGIAHARLGHVADAQRDLEDLLARDHVSPLMRSAARQALTALRARPKPKRT